LQHLTDFFYHRYKEINLRLKRLLADERKSLQLLRQTYASDLKNRSELETMLRQCVEDVRKEIAHRKVQEGLLPSDNDELKMLGRDPAMISIERFTREDRERALELLLSQERVLSLLYAKAFPLDKRDLSRRQDYDLGDRAKSPPLGQAIGSSTGHRYNGLASSSMIDDMGDIPASASRPQSSRNLGTPGERDRQRDKLPSVQSRGMFGVAGSSYARPSTGSRP
jgi:hypothetical protein